MRITPGVLLWLSSCATVSPSVAPSEPVLAPHENEAHFASLKQLSFDGETAEAYWRFDGTGVTLQRSAPGDKCDRIYTMPINDGVAGPMQLFSSGKGATTCAHSLHDDREVLYASTHLGGDECPPKPDMSMGYVWALYDSYDIFKKNADGSGELTRLTETLGYDAEATVCGKDGSIIFTSVRDGDLELYRMDADGKNVKRLTFTPGYDGGAFFNADCSKIVWRASRPKEGKELSDYQALLKQGLVRPTKLELFVANADGSDARQVTYLNAATFAPFFVPGKDRLLFSSNYGDPRGREFDIWAINTDGTQLERITHTPGFDGFPMFSPDGKWLLFSSNRATAPGSHDTNLFIAEWKEADSVFEPGAAERILKDAAWLAAPEREGRGIGTQGLEAAGAYIEQKLKTLGLEVERSPFNVVTKVNSTSTFKVAGKAVSDFVPLAWSSEGVVKGKAVLAGWGLKDEELGFDDFKGLDVKGKVVVARRFVPKHEKLESPEAQRRAGDLRKKAFTAKQLGAKALIIVDWPEEKELPPEAVLPVLRPEGTGEAGIPVVVVKRAALEPHWKALSAKKSIDVQLDVQLVKETTQAFNVVARIPAAAPTGGAVIIGAHYDHLGFGNHNSLKPGSTEAHLGADDNASGTATLLELARALNEQRDTLKSDVIIAAFSGEEDGVLGSSALVKSNPAWLNGAAAMLNLDMVGRLRGNSLSVLGVGSADDWPAAVNAACELARVACITGGDGYGPSDQTSFYAAGLPVLHFFTGAHDDYHKPSDASSKLNAVGMAKVAEIVAAITKGISGTALTYKKIPAPVSGDARSFNASLGTVPNYSGTSGVKGVLLDDVRPGGGADKAGMKRGDVLVKLGQFDLSSVEDLMFVLMQSRPGETVTAVVLRDGQRVELEATFQEGRRR